jgi:hypothetical protein
VRAPTLSGTEEAALDFSTVDVLRERHPAWRLVRALNASLVLSFLGSHFVEGNNGATAEQALVGALDDHLDAINAGAADPVFPRAAREYLTDWSAPETGWLRRFYPHGSDDVQCGRFPRREEPLVSTVGTTGFEPATP